MFLGYQLCVPDLCWWGVGIRPVWNCIWRYFCELFPLDIVVCASPTYNTTIWINKPLSVKREAQKDRQRCCNKGDWQNEVPYQTRKPAEEWSSHFTGRTIAVWWDCGEAYSPMWWLIITSFPFLPWRTCSILVLSTWSVCSRPQSEFLLSWRSCMETCWRWSCPARRADCLSASPSSLSHRLTLFIWHINYCSGLHSSSLDCVYPNWCGVLNGGCV